jgi:hypothetical protein
MKVAITSSKTLLHLFFSKQCWAGANALHFLAEADDSSISAANNLTLKSPTRSHSQHTAAAAGAAAAAAAVV